MWCLHTALNAIKLFLLLSLGLTFLLGQGWLVVGYILHGGLTTRKRDTSLPQEVPLALMSGLIINYGVVLCFQSLTVSLTIGGAIAIVGIYCFAIYAFRYHKQQIWTAVSVNIWGGAILVCLLFLGPILTQPLKDWDARSIWFFHAKMVFVAGSFGQSAGWQHPSVAFSHRDYPGLVPALAAQVAYITGFWNEYMPKTSLFFMLVPAVVWLFTFARRSFSFVILLLLIPFGIGRLLWNGYMDGYLALYFSIAMLLLGRYLNSSQDIDMISSLCCLFAVLYLKNEGILAAFAGLCALIITYFLKGNLYLIKRVFSLNWKYYLAGLIALLPFMLWTLYKQEWHLSNDLGLGTTHSFLRVIGRLADGSYLIILQRSYQQIESALLLLGLLYFASAARTRLLSKESLPSLIAAGIYGLGIMAVYLSTPYNLLWHLDASIPRIMLSVNDCLFIGSYYMLNALEDNPSTHDIQDQLFLPVEDIRR